MPPHLKFCENPLISLDVVSDGEMQALAGEAMGWQPLGPGAYIHVGATEGEENVVHVVGVPDTSLAGLNVLLLA